MNRNLTVTDPLAEQEVTILITLPPSENPRDERPALISVGVTEQLPMSKSGLFGELTALIHEAWTVFGVQLQGAKTVEAQTDVEAQVVATANTEEEETTRVPPPNPKLAPPKPQAQNLSLF